MFPRGEAGEGFATGPALLVVVVFGFRDFFGTLVGSGAETRLFDFVFFAAFLIDFPAAFFTAGFLAAFFAFLTTALLFLARFFDAAALVDRARGGLRAFFAFFFPEVFFLGVATTNSFMAQTGLLGLISGGALPRCFRQQPEHRENQRFSFKIVFCGFARGAIDLFPHLRQPCKAGQVRVGIGVVGTQAFAHPAIDAVDERRKCYPVAAAECVAERMKFARIDPR